MACFFSLVFVCMYVSYCLFPCALADAIGQFTYWSQRTFARPVNRGIRLDYFIASEHFFPAATTTSSSTTSTSTSAEGATAKRREVRPQDLPLPGVADCYILHEDTVGTSDHCPVMLVVRVQ